MTLDDDQTFHSGLAVDGAGDTDRLVCAAIGITIDAKSELDVGSSLAGDVVTDGHDVGNLKTFDLPVGVPLGLAFFGHATGQDNHCGLAEVLLDEGQLGVGVAGVEVGTDCAEDVAVLGGTSVVLQGARHDECGDVVLSPPGGVEDHGGDEAFPT